jgi:hypothetical protein
MTLKYNLESLYRSEFSASELSLIKLLVLTTLREYDDLNVNEASGSIYAKLKQIQSKINVLQSSKRGISGDFQ